MGIGEEMGRLAQEVLASYEARILFVEQIIESTHEKLDAYRSRREAMREQLREALARKTTLRKRDFNAMIRGVLARQEKQEEAVKETMKEYLAAEKAQVGALRESLARKEAGGTETAKNLLKHISAQQKEREQEVRVVLTDFQKEQEETAQALGGLLSQEGSLSIKGFKETIQDLLSRWSRRESGRARTCADKEIECASL